MIAHGLGDLKEVSARAVEAGVDMDMVSEGYLGTLQQSLEEGRIPLSDIDRACRLVLEAKFKLGLFDDPYRYCDPQRAATQIYTPAHRAEARRIAGESFVLLKNEGDVRERSPWSARWPLRARTCPARGASLPTSRSR